MAKPDLTAIFATDGRLSESIDGFQPRQAQVELAQAVAQTIDDNGLLVAEAGTGTGKTFAYLIPAILSGKKILVSTATKNLQQQLFSKDLPKLKKICQRYPKTLLLKGRENYLCQARLELAPLQEALTKDEKQTLGKLQVWAANTKTGDLSECPGLNEQDSLWQKVCAKLEFCQANNCQKDSDCFYPQRKVQATDADIIVVNHHLFCADLALREQGISELLPACDVYIFDEAHQLADIAAQFLGFNLSRFQLEELVRDIKEAQAAEAADSQDLVDRAQALQAHIKALNATLGSWDKRWTWQELQATSPFMEAIDELLSHLQALHDQLSQLEKRGKLLASLARKTQTWVENLAHWIQTDDPTQVRWLESSQARFRLSLVPLNVDGPFNRQRAALGGSWIFTSATLSVQGQFDYFMHRLGVQKAQTLALASPFDYTKQGAIYHPVGLPDPKQADYIKICLRAVWPLLQLSGGRAFLLFTSFKALNEAKAILTSHWDGQLLVQGEGDKNSLLEQFKLAQRAILLGTQSFWEGVDVKGEALQLVMIDRIPFSPPDDPIVQAREAYLKSQGLNGFAHFQLPEAIMNLKQGCGRLIRDTADRGVLVLCDPRLTQKGYGKRIRDSLPPFPWHEQPEPVKAFLAEPPATANSPEKAPKIDPNIDLKRKPRMSAILALDATTANCSVSLVFEDGHAITRSEWVPQGHARVILPWVDEVLQEAKFDPQDLRALAWVQGPGAFTGLRIAAGVVQGLALGWQKPVISLPSLEVLIHQIPTGKRQVGQRYWALLDARMDEVYAQAFQFTDQGLIAEATPQLWPLKDLRMALAEPHQGSIGDLMNLKQGWDSLKPLLHDWRAAWPEAEEAGKLAWTRLEQAWSLETQLPEPVYLRPSVVR